MGLFYFWRRGNKLWNNVIEIVFENLNRLDLFNCSIILKTLLVEEVLIHIFSKILQLTYILPTQNLSSFKCFVKMININENFVRKRSMVCVGFYLDDDPFMVIDDSMRFIVMKGKWIKTNIVDFFGLLKWTSSALKENFSKVILEV